MNQNICFSYLIRLLICFLSCFKFVAQWYFSMISLYPLAVIVPLLQFPKAICSTSNLHNSLLLYSDQFALSDLFQNMHHKNGSIISLTYTIHQNIWTVIEWSGEGDHNPKAFQQIFVTLAQCQQIYLYQSSPKLCMHTHILK